MIFDFDLLAILGMLFAMMTLPGTLELFILSLGAALALSNCHFFGLFGRKSNLYEMVTQQSKRLVVIIPAHNEEHTIGRLLESFQRCTGDFDLVVVADHCTDRTVEIAEGFGVRTIIREGSSRLGKKETLEDAFSSLIREPYDLFAVIDADSIVKANLISTIHSAFQSQTNAIQLRYLLSKNHLSLFQRLSHLAFTAFNYLRPKGREYWGFSAGLLGNGFVLSRSLLLKVPFKVDSIVEDVAYHVQLVKEGYHVKFIEDSGVWAALPPTLKAVAKQSARWEGGRLRLARKSIVSLTIKIMKGRLFLIEPLLDLLLFPLSFHVLIVAPLLFIPFPIVQVYALVSLSIVFLYLTMTLKLSKSDYKDVVALFLIPFYLVWKLLILFKIFKASKKGAPWDRTDRS